MRKEPPKKEADSQSHAVMSKLRAHMGGNLGSLQLEEEIRFYDEQLMMRAGRMRSEKHRYPSEALTAISSSGSHPALPPHPVKEPTSQGAKGLNSSNAHGQREKRKIERRIVKYLLRLSELER